MDGALKVLPLVCLMVLFSTPSSSFPLCTDLRAPSSVKGRLAFCPYAAKSCCNASEDLVLQERFEAMSISHPPCAAAVKSVLCAACDPFSAELFKIDSDPRTVPVLCNSAKDGNFCSSVWETCQNATILNIPFAPALHTKAQVSQNGTSSKLTDIWESKSEFCEAFGGVSTDNSLCFNGEPVSLKDTVVPQIPKGMCLEKVSNGSYINMVAHPDGSNRAFFSNLAGRIWLATIPDQDSGDSLGLDETNPFVDLTDEVHLDIRFGMMGMAFHPKFAQNGRFFASYNCDKETSPHCEGRCACNSDVKCDPSQLESIEIGPHCKHHMVVAEYSASGSGSSPSKAQQAKPQEIRRIITVGMPFESNHGGQILFGPEDGYMYIMLGDGGSRGDPFNFAQNKRSLLGKIMRVDVDKIPSQEEIAEHDAWGNYSIPQDNPYSEDQEMAREIWAYGLRNPWRCSFDAERLSYFFCGDIGQNQYEEVNIISKGGNYGWRVYEGPILFQPQKTPGGNTSADSIDPIFSVAGYSHSNISTLGSAALIGGYLYRAKTDPCMYGSYLYGDLYSQHMWAASETPQNSGTFTTNDIPFTCAFDSPIKCDSAPNSNRPAFQTVFSFGEDNRKDIYILTQSGVYRVVRPSRCNYTCSKENATVSPSAPAPSAAAPCYHVTQGSRFKLWVSLFLLFLEFFM